MRCLECNTEIPENSLYCPKCGNPVQMVPDYNSLEDILAEGVNDLLMQQKREEAQERLERRQQAAIDAAVRRGEARSYENERNRIRRKKQRTRNIILIVLALAVLVIAGIAYVTFHLKGGSYDYQMSRAEAVYGQGAYYDAMAIYEKASRMREDAAEPIIGIGKCYLALTDRNEAEACYLKAIEVDGSSEAAYRAAVEFYEGEQDFESLTALIESCPTDSIRSTFAGHLVAVPEFSVPGNTYEEPVSLELNAKYGKIHYTLDGTPASADSPVYDAPIELSESGSYTVNAVSVSTSGSVSENTVAQYVIRLSAPDNPVVTPNAGLYNNYQVIEVQCSEDCTVYYTLDGSDPDENSEIYEEPIEMPEGECVFSCVAVNSVGLYSSVIRRAYNLIYLY